MNLEHIPRSFWHSLSVSVLILTLGTVYVTYKSGNLSLKYKDFEFATMHATNEIEAAKTLLTNALAAKEAELKRLAEEKKATEAALTAAKGQIAQIQASLASRKVEESARALAELTTQIEESSRAAAVGTFPDRAASAADFDQRQIKLVEDRLKNIGTIQQQLRAAQPR